MKHALRHLIIGTAVGVFSLGAYAQSTSSTTPPSPSTPKMTGTPADLDYGAAKAACEQQTGAARADCLRKAEAERDRAQMDKGGGTDTPSGGAQAGTAGSNSGATGSAASRASGGAGKTTGGASGTNSGTSGPER